MEESRVACFGASIFFSQIFGYSYPATLNVMNSFTHAALVHVDPKDFYSMLVYYFSLLKTSTSLSSETTDLNLMISVAVYINKMHSECGFELWNYLQNEVVEVKELLSMEAKLVPYMYVLPALLTKKDISQINVVLESAAQSASRCSCPFYQIGAQEAGQEEKYAEANDPMCVDLLCHNEVLPHWGTGIW